MAQQLAAIVATPASLAKVFMAASTFPVVDPSRVSSAMHFTAHAPH
jgi:hypothetical protein